MDGIHHFLNKALDRGSTEMSLHLLSYKPKMSVKILGIAALMEPMQA